MKRNEAIAIIHAALPSLDDEGASVLAEVAQSLVSESVPFELTAEERAGVVQSIEDFKAGRTYSAAEARAATDAFLKRLSAGKAGE
ncbi:MAG: hypothetical protein ACT4N2_11655 [Hyphomicrobium sp.]